MKIALGVCGGIAAYKACEIVRLLQEQGITVQVVMTDAAQQFVRPLPYAALSGQKVITGLWNAGAEQPNLDSAVEHISVAQSIEALLVAPATADVLAKFVHGEANDFLTTLFLATTAPVILAPAMNVNMWQHPATQANLEALKKRGARIVDPGSGYLACGMTGPGRLAEPEAIVTAALEMIGVKQDLVGETVLVTAGPTREAIDPVCYLTNRSSGKMGYSIAEAALHRGARVILISGPVSITPPDKVELVRVRTADEMKAAVLRYLPEASIVIKAAAVADYRVRQAAGQKLKRQAPLTLELEPTADILVEIATRRTPQQIIIGFAAETEDVLENGRRKMQNKKLDAIVINDVSQPGIGFDSDNNAVTILTSEEVIEIPKVEKTEVAQRILDVALKVKKSERRRAPAPR